jgi:hypothetical protein
MANVLSTAKRVQIVSALVEGCGIRATARMADVSKDTVMKLWREIGMACIRYQDEAFRNLTCKRLQVDEIWSFVYAKAKNVPVEMRGTFGVGDVWTFTAIDADTKLMPSFLVGSRDGGCATEFLQDLASRLVNRVQLTTDGHKNIPGGGRGRLCGRDRLRAAPQDLWQRADRPGDALQPGEVHRVREEAGGGLIRTPGTSPPRMWSGLPDDPDVPPAVHATYQRLLEEGREPYRRPGALPCALQPVPHP